MPDIASHPDSLCAASPQGLGGAVNRLIDAYADARLDPRSGALPHFAKLAVALKAAAIAVDLDEPGAEDLHGEALRALMVAPAPDLAALELKLMLAFGDDCEAGPLAADLLRPILLDVVRMKRRGLN